MPTKQSEKNWRIPTLKEVEKALIIKTLSFYKGHRESSAKSLGLGERTLYRKLKEYKILQVSFSGNISLEIKERNNTILRVVKYNPNITRKQLGKLFGLSEGSICQILTSNQAS